MEDGWMDVTAVDSWFRYARAKQMAFDSIVSDYGLTCGSLLLGTAAAASRKRTQPAYVFVNEWAPTLQGMYDPR